MSVIWCHVLFSTLKNIHDAFSAVRALIDELDDAASILRGSRELRMKKKKTAFETTPYAQAVRDGLRCFPMGQLLQHSRALGAPAAALKIGRRGQLTEWQEWIRRFVHVSYVRVRYRSFIDTTNSADQRLQLNNG